MCEHNRNVVEISGRTLVDRHLSLCITVSTSFQLL